MSSPNEVRRPCGGGSPGSAGGRGSLVGFWVHHLFHLISFCVRGFTQLALEMQQKEVMEDDPSISGCYV